MSTEPLLRVCNLSKRFERRPWFGRPPEPVRALDGVSLSVNAGGTLGLVGASGSGKSTLARCLVRREPPSEGDIFFEGRSILTTRPRLTREFCHSMQLIAQDPGASLNPRYPAGWIVQEPLRVRSRAQAAELLSLAGLPRDCADWPPARFSGGQRARIALARALACRPKLLILDESLNRLDLSIQAQMINLLLDLQSRFGLAYIFITHDLALAGHVADKIAVLDRGRIVEQGVPAEVLRRPSHPATLRLLAAAPSGGRKAS